MSVELSHRVLSRHGKSFALAAKLLPPESRDDAAVLYAYCRRADDAVDDDDAPVAVRVARVEQLRRELDSVYAREEQSDPLLAAFQQVVQRRGIPVQYPRDLLAGLATDVSAVRFRTLDELLLYSYRVAGVVGLMMCHVTGLRDPRALENAVHLGIAMQITNVCRDVEEDFRRGRVYLPASLLREHGAAGMDPDFDGSLAPYRSALGRVLKSLLTLAERYYASGDAGIPALPPRAALAVRAARLVYAAIGDELARRRYDVLAGRAVVSFPRKLLLVLRAAATELCVRAGALVAPRPLLGPGESHGRSISLHL
jgi:phytoene synthase